MFSTVNSGERGVTGVFFSSAGRRRDPDICFLRLFHFTIARTEWLEPPVKHTCHNTSLFLKLISSGWAYSTPMTFFAYEYDNHPAIRVYSIDDVNILLSIINERDKRFWIKYRRKLRLWEKRIKAGKYVFWVLGKLWFWTRYNSVDGPV